MTNTPTDRISDIVAAQRQFFAEGATLDLRFRIDALKILRDAIKKWERPLADALWQDLHKSYEEAYLTELSICAVGLRPSDGVLRSNSFRRAAASSPSRSVRC